MAVPSKNNLLMTYRQMVDEGAITADTEQERVLQSLEALNTQLSEYLTRQNSLLKRVFRGDTLSDHTQGLYIYGDVGRGKSMLMDLFFDHVTITCKKRVHFHAFMLDVHDRIHQWRQQKSHQDADPIHVIAKAIGKEAALLCFDEFQVTDIADAMILGRLFEQIFKEGTFVVATSNRHPDMLYDHGLQRERFLPFINMFKTRLDIISLNGDTDYRLQHFRGLTTTYFTPLGKAASRFIQESFLDLSGGNPPTSGTLHNKGRDIPLPAYHTDIACFSFDELCNRPLGATDYLEIATRFNTILLSDIPQLSKEHRNEAKRFVTLIDALYEHHTKLICSAAVSPKELYTEGDGNFEFQRTVSRLIEMQSDQYIASQHIGTSSPEQNTQS